MVDSGDINNLHNAGGTVAIREEERDYTQIFIWLITNGIILLYFLILLIYLKKFRRQEILSEVR